MIDLTDEQQTQLTERIAKFKGSATTLESAIGALVLGQHYGWRVLKIIHTPSTYKKYETILDITFQELCPERTELSKKSFGLAAADKLNSFWSVVMGKTPIKNKGMLVDPEEGSSDNDRQMGNS
ncbi:MAG: hypothetical protein ACJAWL_002630 [Motiliproteus sp.]|jgi:hypothetical protein